MRKWFKKIPLLSLGAAGFLFGMILGIISSGGAEYLDSDRLCDMKEMGVEQKDFQEDIRHFSDHGSSALCRDVQHIGAYMSGCGVDVFRSLGLCDGFLADDD